MTELTGEQKSRIDEAARRKMNFMEVEYWRVRNGKSKYMECPYCTTGKKRARNYIDGKSVCCALFAKAFEAIMDRQDQVNIAAQHARTIHTLGQMVEGRVN